MINIETIKEDLNAGVKDKRENITISFADDNALLTKNETKLQNTLTQMEEMLAEYRMKVNKQIKLVKTTMNI